MPEVIAIFIIIFLLSFQFLSFVKHLMDDAEFSNERSFKECLPSFSLRTLLIWLTVLCCLTFCFRTPIRIFFQNPPEKSSSSFTSEELMAHYEIGIAVAIKSGSPEELHRYLGKKFYNEFYQGRHFSNKKDPLGYARFWLFLGDYAVTQKDLDVAIYAEEHLANLSRFEVVFPIEHELVFKKRIQSLKKKILVLSASK